MEYSYKFRIYPNTEQQTLIQKTFGCSRFVYNHFLAQRIALYKAEQKGTNYVSQSRELTALKHEMDWLREPDKCALQNSLKDLDAAYKNFFRSVKSGGKVGFPKFKSKRDRRKSYKTSGTVRVYGNYIRLPKLGLVKCRVSKEVKGEGADLQMEYAKPPVANTLSPLTVPM